MTRNELSREPLVIGSDYSRWPMPGQLSLPLASVGERNTFDGDVSTVERAIEAPDNGNWIRLGTGDWIYINRCTRCGEEG